VETFCFSPISGNANVCLSWARHKGHFHACFPSTVSCSFHFLSPIVSQWVGSAKAQSAEQKDQFPWSDVLRVKPTSRWLAEARHSVRSPEIPLLFRDTKTKARWDSTFCQLPPLPSFQGFVGCLGPAVCTSINHRDGESYVSSPHSGWLLPEEFLHYEIVPRLSK